MVAELISTIALMNGYHDLDDLDALDYLDTSVLPPRQRQILGMIRKVEHMVKVEEL